MGSTETAEAWTELDALQLMPEIEWPAPWQLVDIQKEYGDDASIPDELLELTVGAKNLKEAAEQVSQNSRFVENFAHHSWALFRNSETTQMVFLRTITVLDPKTELVHPVISAVIFCYNLNAYADAKSIDTRNFPTAKFEEALYYKYLSKKIAINRLMIQVVCTADNNMANWKPSEPIKNRDLQSHTFLAQVATQYEWLQRQHPDMNITSMMSDLNEVSVKTVQKWLTLARKAELLLPTHRGRKSRTTNTPH